MNEQQLKLRQTLLTGTNIAPIFGKSKFRTAYDIYCGKKGLLERTPPTAAMIRGTFLEVAILDYYQADHGVELERDLGTVVHTAENWMGASPDAVYTTEEGTVIVDAKTSRRKDGWGVPGSDDVPDDYQLQLHWYAAVLRSHEKYRNIKRLDVIVYFPVHDEFCTYSIEPNVEFEQKLIERARDWWYKHIVCSVAPPMDHSTSACRMADSQPYEAPDMEEVDEAEGLLIRDLIQVKSDIDELVKQKKTLENQIKVIIGSKAGIYDNTNRATWKEQKGRSGFDQKSFKTDHPELYEQYKKEGKPFRVLRIK